VNLLEMIAIETGLSPSDADRIITTAPRRYKVYQIPKRSGGSRTIAQPSREVKLLQRLLIDQWLSKLPVHRAAMAYVNSKNIIDNARSHQRNRAILKLDFESFFPSIRVRDWKHFLSGQQLPWDGPGDSMRVSKILFWGQGARDPICLSIGAPTSPLISNLLMFELDTQFSEIANLLDVSYTRYADDITASARTIEQLNEFEKQVRRALRICKTPRLKINESKRGIYTSGRRRMVTGLILTPSGEVSIGRERKRKISTLLHLFGLGRLDVNQLGYLKGMLGFSIANEPNLVNRLRRKYGDEIVDRVLKTHLPKRHELAALM
jgi:RNA-directed DNA polymerase